MVGCTKTVQINKAKIKWPCGTTQSKDFVDLKYFAHNQAIVDVLNANFYLDIELEFMQMSTMLSDDIPTYQLQIGIWYKRNHINNVYDNDSHDLIEVNSTCCKMLGRKWLIGCTVIHRNGWLQCYMKEG